MNTRTCTKVSMSGRRIRATGAAGRRRTAGRGGGDALDVVSVKCHHGCNNSKPKLPFNP
ncbi:MAG: hypothetical protein P1P80_02890 [ANME-2 cluster archaeon]|nr:hypothetical protein [ANME-2 cluster archaeon]